MTWNSWNAASAARVAITSLKAIMMVSFGNALRANNLESSLELNLETAKQIMTT